MKHVGGKVDLKGWDLDALEAVDVLKESVLKAASEALQYAFETDETFLYLPSRGIASDSIEIQLLVDIGAEPENPTFQFSLTELIDFFIESCVLGDGKIHGEEAKNAKALSSGLRMLSDRIDSACE